MHNTRLPYDFTARELRLEEMVHDTAEHFDLLLGEPDEDWEAELQDRLDLWALADEDKERLLEEVRRLALREFALGVLARDEATVLENFIADFA